MKNILTLCIGLLCTSLIGQNLVNNPSFENQGPCPIISPDFTDAITPWDTTGKTGAIGYFNQNCGDPGGPNTTNNATAFDGDGFLGMLLYAPGSGLTRSYIHTKLKEPLDSGALYRATFYVRPVLNDALGIGLGIDNISLAFTDSIFDSIPPGGAFLYDAQVSNENPIVNQLQWTAICGIFMADGTEEYMTIGNFASDLETTAEPLDGSSNPQFAFYLVDFVSVVKNDIPTLPKDTFICRKGRIDVDMRFPDLTVLWQDGEQDNFYSITEPGTYFARISNRACSFYDTIVVVEGNCDDCKVFVPNAFTPDNDGTNDAFKVVVGEACPEILSFRISIYDRWGQKVFESIDPNVSWTPGNEFEMGTYTYALEWEYELFSARQRSQKRGSLTLLR
jgi:gliding motility-associated-like protein